MLIYFTFTFLKLGSTEEALPNSSVITEERRSASSRQNNTPVSQGSVYSLSVNLLEQKQKLIFKLTLYRTLRDRLYNVESTCRLNGT